MRQLVSWRWPAGQLRWQLASCSWQLGELGSSAGQLGGQQLASWAGSSRSAAAVIASLAPSSAAAATLGPIANSEGLPFLL